MSQPPPPPSPRSYRLYAVRALCRAYHSSMRRVVALPLVVSWRTAALYRSAVPLYHDPKLPPQPRYKSLYRDPAPSNSHYMLYHRLPGRIVVEQWPCRGLLCRVMARPCALPPSPVSRYSPLYRDSHKEEMSRSLAPPALGPFFFSHHFFSTSFQLLEIPQKIYFFFHFSVNQINLLTFILFICFSSFTHCKTPEKIFQHIPFFSFNSGPFCQIFSNNLFSH